MIKRIVLISIVLVIILVGVSVGYHLGCVKGRNEVISKTAHHEAVSLTLSSSEALGELKQHFPVKQNYTQLLEWESSRINYTRKSIERHTNPIEILNYTLGRCGEFSILYVSICLANDIPARLVTDLVVDHVWAEVNPSRDGKTWIHAEPTDSCTRIQKGRSIYDIPPTIDNPSYYKKKSFQMVFAFQVIEEGQVQIVDRTSYYSP